MSAVDTFRGISLLIFKWLLYALLFIVVLTALLIAGWWVINWYTVDRHLQKVAIMVYTEKKDCDDDLFPIFVMIGNSSEKTVERVTFTLAARVKGRSTNLAEYHSYSDDRIIEAKTGWAQCWAVPKLRETVKDPRALDWGIEYKTIKLKD